MCRSNILVWRGLTVKQAALYRKVEPETQPYPGTLEGADDGDWSPRRRVATILAAALASWAIVIAAGYGLYSLFF
ncbi:hypothetical protein JL101_012140 [Skermanella rosea]|uniref:hypothetical protein n=1 Tax=Skermanella rosea TaxID=1817965 RepID=UPI001E4ED52C|nr:hypothetical protein [Skermanella rosea]UEM06146.1 hypothetical protein JL101_012140 [Skermanella rosea]